MNALRRQQRINLHGEDAKVQRALLRTTLPEFSKLGPTFLILRPSKLLNRRLQESELVTVQRRWQQNQLHSSRKRNAIKISNMIDRRK